jgi:hypothetical protein
MLSISKSYIKQVLKNNRLAFSRVAESMLAPLLPEFGLHVGGLRAGTSAAKTDAMKAGWA